MANPGELLQKYNMKLNPDGKTFTVVGGSNLSPEEVKEIKAAKPGIILLLKDRQAKEQASRKKTPTTAGAAAAYGVTSGPTDLWGNMISKGLRAASKLGPLNERLYGPISESYDEALNLYRTNRDAAKEDRPALTGGLRIASNVASDPLTYGPVVSGLGAKGLGKRLLQGVGEAGLDEYVRSGGDMSAARKAAGYGGVAAGTLNLLGKGVRGAARTILPDTKDTLKAAKEFERAGVTPSVGDLLPEESGYRSFETVAEDMPFTGMKKFRSAQKDQLQEGMEGLQKKFQKKAAKGDLTENLQEVRNLKKQEATRLYDRVEEAEERIAKGRGPNSPPRRIVNMDRVRKYAQKIIDEETASGIAEPNLKLAKKMEGYLGLKNMSFRQARKNRSRLLSEIRRTQKRVTAGTASDEELAVLNGLRVELEDSMHDWARKSGGMIWDLYRQASDYFERNVVPFKDRTVRGMLDRQGGLAEEKISKQLLNLQEKYPRQAQSLWNALPQANRNQVKGLLIQEIYDDTLDTISREGGKFHPGMAASQLEHLLEKNKNMFLAEDVQDITAVIRAIRMAPRASAYLANSQAVKTGNRLVPFIAGGAAVAPGAIYGGVKKGGPGALLGAAGGYGIYAGAAKFFQSEAGRRTVKVMAKIREQDPIAPVLAASILRGMGILDDKGAILMSKGQQVLGRRSAKIAPLLGPQTKERQKTNR